MPGGKLVRCLFCMRKFEDETKRNPPGDNWSLTFDVGGETVTAEPFCSRRCLIEWDVESSRVRSGKSGRLRGSR